MKLPEIGKISPEVFNELIYPRLGAKRKEVLVSPQHGVDVDPFWGAFYQALREHKEK